MRKILTLLTVLMLGIFAAHAQSRTITGRITDNQGQPVEGASIQVKGTTRGTTSNSTGAFSLSVNTGETLTISGTGYGSQDILINSQQTLNVSLSTTTGNLSEVVVTTALGVQRQARSLGYATAKVSGNDLNEAKVTNIASGLAAKVSGLQINLVNNGVRPDVRVTLRGTRSFLGNNQALLVVDGNILPIRFLNSLSPSDVENATVLKGASASALYGTDASNGVIIITTRKGRGVPKINVSSTVSLESISTMPKLQNRFGQNGGEYNPNTFAQSIYFPEDPFKPYVPYENQQYGPEFNGAEVPIGTPVRIFNADGTFFDSVKTGTYSAKPSAKRDFFDKGLTFQNNVSYSSGDDNSNFFMSFEDLDTKGIVPKDVNHRNTFRVNGMKKSGKFTADYALSYAITHTNTTPNTYVPFRWGTSDYTGNYEAGTNVVNGVRQTGGSYYQGRPVYWTLINAPANIDLRDYRNWQTDPFASPDGYFDAYYGNPWWQIDQARFDEKNNDFIGSASLAFKPTKWVNLSYRFSYARNDYNNNYTKAGYNFADWAIQYGISGPASEGTNIASNLTKLDPSAGTGTSLNQRITSDFLASLTHSFFNNNLDATLLLGNQVSDRNFRAQSLSTSTLIIPDFYNVAANASGQPFVGQTTYHSRIYGVFGDLTLGYKGLLFLHGSARNDWTSLLSKENRSFFYPSGDLSFVFSELLKNGGPAWLNYGKIRGALSRTGQISVDPYQLAQTYPLGTGFPYGGQGGSTVGNTFANPNIKPEKTTEKEIGLELGLFKDRITFSAAFYQQNTVNQTISINISNTTGFTSALVNSGEMENKGVELDGKVSIIQSSKVRWDVGANFAYNKNTVKNIGFDLTDIPVGSTGTNTFAVIGKPYGVLKVIDWQRDDQGRIIVSPTTGFPQLAGPLVYFGTTTPPTKIGVNTSLSFKGFTLNVLADGRFGAVIYNDLGQDLDFTGSSWYSAQGGRQTFVIPNSVIPSTSVKGAYVPNTNVSIREGNNLFWASTWNQAQSPYVNSADFWKLREVSLSYQFPSSVLSRSKVIKAANFGLVGRNLFIIRAKDNPWSDPEFSNSSGNDQGTTDINQTPPTRFYGATLQLTF